MKEKRILKKCTAFFIAFAMAFSVFAALPVIDAAARGTDSENVVYAAAKPTYTISAKTKPADAKIWKFSRFYNKYTKHYWTITSYIEKLSKKGGGTLILKKGTYTLPASIQVPSNITIKFKNGVVIKKTKKTGCGMKSNTPLFQMVDPKKYKKSGAVGKYNGTKNVEFIGEGKVVFDMNYLKGNACAIILAHNQNMHFSGITFKNSTGHFFELDASKNVTIENCKFYNIKGGITEAINLDTPDKATGGFSFRWSKFDKTPNKNVTISNNYFSNMPRAIGTHKYSQTKKGVNKYHTNIKVINNKMVKMKSNAITPLCWKNSLIDNNVMSGPKIYNKNVYGMLCGGAVNVTISNNTFKGYTRTIVIRTAKNGGKGSEYKTIYPKVTEANKQALATNKYDSTVPDGKARIMLKSISKTDQFIDLQKI